MGGAGSGCWCRWDKKTTTEEVRRIDVRYLRKLGALRGSGYFGNLSWSRGGEQMGSIRYRVDKNCLLLMYRHRSYGSEWKEIEERVWLDKTPCNFGGERTWLLCPHCGCRVAVIYGAGARFLCRHCYRLPYSSQNEVYADRMRRKARKARRRLDASDNLTIPVWRKPKGMHWKTFERLRREEEIANKASIIATMEKLEGYGWQGLP